jgi:hypothetical protein
MNRPTGVTVLAILSFIGAFFSILGGLALLGLSGFLGAVGGTGLAVLFGVYALVWGVIAVWIAYGLWTLNAGIWRWALFLQVAGILVTIIEIVLQYASISGGIISIVINGIIIYYLTTPGVRAAFGQPTGGTNMEALMMAFGGGGASAAASAPPAPPAPAAAPVAEAPAAPTPEPEPMAAPDLEPMAGETATAEPDAVDEHEGHDHDGHDHDEDGAPA